MRRINGNIWNIMKPRITQQKPESHSAQQSEWAKNIFTRAHHQGISEHYKEKIQKTSKDEK